jgi:hypothetical protein
MIMQQIALGLVRVEWLFVVLVKLVLIRAEVWGVEERKVGR